MSDEGMSDAALEQFRIAVEYMHSCPEQVIMRDTSLMRALIARLDAAERERDAMREALQVIVDGGEPRPLGKSWFPDLRTSKHDQCTHGVWMYEDCGNCTSGYARAALTANHSAPVVD